MERFAMFVGAVLITLAWAFQPSRATLILDLNTGGSPVPCVGCAGNGTTFGYAFHVSNPVAVDGIGVWDNGSDDLGVNVQAGLWTISGTLLASATITDGSSIPVASASTDGRWLFEDISVVTLSSGDYLIGALFGSLLPTSQLRPPFSTIPDIGVIGGTKGADGVGFAVPDVPFSDPIFGPTLRVAAAPEPASLALISLGLIGFGFGRRRRA